MAFGIHFYFYTFYILGAFKVIFVKSQCDGSPLNVTVNEETGSFKFPTSGEYSANLSCAWLISSAYGEPILYKVFNIEINCTDGYSLYKGNSVNPSSTVDTDVCTPDFPFSKTMALSSTPILYLTFTSDGTSSPGEDLGFQFLAISTSHQSKCSTSGSKIYLTATTSSQVITSTNFPDKYPENHQCEWIISPSDSGATVIVTFTFVDVEREHATSCFDKLKVTYGESLSQTLEFCGDEDFSPNRIFDNGGSGGNITIFLDSDNTQPERGFVATYIQSVVTSATTEAPTTTTTTTTESSSITTTTEAPTTATTTSTESSTITTTTEAPTTTTTTTTESSTITTTTEAPTTTTTSTESSTITTTTEAPTTTTTSTESSTITTTTEAPTTTTTTAAPSTTTPATTSSESLTTSTTETLTTTSTIIVLSTTSSTETSTTTTEAQTTSKSTEFASTTTTMLPTTTTTKPPLLKTFEPLLDSDEAIPIVSGAVSGLLLIFVCILVISILLARKLSRNGKKQKSKQYDDNRYRSNSIFDDKLTYANKYQLGNSRNEIKKYTKMDDRRRNYNSNDENEINRSENYKDPRVPDKFDRYSYRYEQNWNNEYV